MPDVRQQLASMKQRWSELSRRVKLLSFAAVVVLLAGAILLATRPGEPSMVVLFSGLSDQDVAEIGERLRTMQVPVQLEQSGTILVPEDRVHELRLSLAAENLPNGGSVGFEIFDQQRFGESEFAEQVNYHRALEGELGRTLSHLAGVERARVHLVLPERSLFASPTQTASASVAMRLRPGFTMSPDQIRGVVHLVASSVRGLTPEHVTVVDQRGRRLSSGATESELGGTDAIGFTRRIEEDRERAAQQLLDATLGPGRSAVHVAAQLSFAHEERTEERYDPATVSTRSFQVQEEMAADGTGTTSGVVGAQANLSGEPVATGTTADGRVLRRSETRNFEVSRVTVHSNAPLGRVERLSVALVVDGHWRGRGSARRFSRRSEAELRGIESLVSDAVGLDRERGDRITVECVPMSAPAPSAGSGASRTTVLVRRYAPHLAGAGALLACAIVLAIVRRRRGAKTEVQPSVPTAHALGPGGHPPLELPRPPAHALESEVPGDLEHRLLAAELAARDPETAARIVRGWLAEDAA